MRDRDLGRYIEREEKERKRQQVFFFMSVLQSQSYHFPYPELNAGHAVPCASWEREAQSLLRKARPQTPEPPGMGSPARPQARGREGGLGSGVQGERDRVGLQF